MYRRCRTQSTMKRSSAVSGNRSRSVARFRQDVGRLVGNGGALVPDVGHVAGVRVADGVGDDLSSAVRQLDAILAGRRVAVPRLVVAEVGAAVVRVGLETFARVRFKTFWHQLVKGR